MNRKIIGATVGSPLPKSNLMQTDPTKGDYVKGKEEFLKSVGGAGANGLSAYEIAKNNGFSGSETEWLASLKGSTGPQGPAGEQGAAGKTPIKGTDYFTPSDVRTIASEAVSKYPKVLHMAVSTVREDDVFGLTLACDLDNGNTYQTTIVLDSDGTPISIVDNDGYGIDISWEGF